MGAELDFDEKNESLLVDYTLDKESNEFIGNKVEHFSFEGLLGSGNFGSVHKVRSKNNHKLYAMKIIEDKKVVNDLLRTKLENEIKILGKLHHPKLVKYYSQFKENEKTYIIMEYVNGKTLKVMIDERSKNKNYFEEKDIVFLLYQCLTGLMYLHEELKIAHRDIKPENIMYDQEKKDIKITDFGVSGSFDKNEDVKLRIQGTQVGTLQFMPQEVLHNEKYEGPEFDVFSLGVSFYQMMSFGFPYKTVPNMKLRMYNLERTGVELPDRYSSELKDLIKSMISIDAKDRPSFKTCLYKLIKFSVIKYFQNSSLNACLLCLYRSPLLNKYFLTNENINKILNSPDDKPVTKKFLGLIKYVKENNGLNTSDIYLKKLVSFKFALAKADTSIPKYDEVSPIKFFETVIGVLHKENAVNTNPNLDVNSLAANTDKSNEQQMFNYTSACFNSLGTSEFNMNFYFLIRKLHGCKCGMVKSYEFGIYKILSFDLNEIYKQYSSTEYTVFELLKDMNTIKTYPSNYIWTCNNYNCRTNNSYYNEVKQFYSTGPNSLIIYFDDQNLPKNVKINVQIPIQLNIYPYIYKPVPNAVINYKLTSMIIKENYNNDKIRYMAATKGNNIEEFNINEEAQTLNTTLDEVFKRGFVNMAIFDKK